MFEAVVLEVVGADDGLAGRDRLAGRAVAERSSLVVDGGAADDAAGTGEVGEPDPAGGRHHEIDPDALGAEEAGGLVDDVLEEVRRIADRGDPGGDLAEGPLRVGLPAELLPRLVQLLDEAGVRHRDRGLAGERLDDPRVDLTERVGLAGVDGQRPERPAVADERNRDDGSDLVAADVGVRRRGVLEAVVVEVVAGEDRATLADGLARDPLARLGLAGPGDRAEPGAPAGQRVVGPVEAATRLVEDVDAGAVGTEERGLPRRPIAGGPPRDAGGR